MGLQSFQVDIYEGTSEVKRLSITNVSYVDGQIDYISVSKSVQDLYQFGDLRLINIIKEPKINDKVIIYINDVEVFSGYVQSIHSDYKGLGSRDITLVGKTYDLYRYTVGHPTALPYVYGNDTTFNIISNLVTTHTQGDITIGATPPETSNYFISGIYDLQYFSVGEAIELISMYDDYSYYLDDNNVLQYFHSSGIQATITDSDLLRVGRTGDFDVDISQKDDEIWNEVIVTGGVSDGVSIVSIVQDIPSIIAYGKHCRYIRDARIKTQEDADLLAQKYLAEHKYVTYEGTIKIKGNENLILEQDIYLDLKELGIEGQYELTQLTHIISMDRGFITKIDFGRIPYNPSDDIKTTERVTSIHDKLLAAIEFEASEGAKVFYQAVAPTLEESTQNDLWIDSNVSPVHGGIHKLYIFRHPNWVRADNFEADWDLIENKPETIDHPDYINKSTIIRNTDISLDTEFTNTYDQDIMISSTIKVMISGVSDYGVSVQVEGNDGWEADSIVQFSEEEVGQFKGIITNNVTFVVPKDKKWKYVEWEIGEYGEITIPHETIILLKTQD